MSDCDCMCRTGMWKRKSVFEASSQSWSKLPFTTWFRPRLVIPEIYKVLSTATGG